jgi:sec-independent protein translocase protein TatA
MGGIGLGEFILIFAILVLVFGGGKIPELGNSIGKAIRSFKRASSTNEDIKVLSKDEADAAAAKEADAAAAKPEAKAGERPAK